jgi:hypothetical protein
VGVRGSYQILAKKVAMKQLCDDLRQFAHEVYQLGHSLEGGAAERECLDLGERMLAAVNQAEARMVSTKFAPRAHMRC